MAEKPSLVHVEIFGQTYAVRAGADPAYVEKLAAFAQKMVPDNPLHPKTQLGTILDDTQTKRIMGYIEAGRKEGARVVTGGKQVHLQSGGYYIEPTVFDNARDDMTIAGIEHDRRDIGADRFEIVRAGLAQQRACNVGFAGD